jgi:hypothetical protein
MRDWAGFDHHGELRGIVSRPRVFVWMKVDFDIGDLFTSTGKLCCQRGLNYGGPVRQDMRNRPSTDD